MKIWLPLIIFSLLAGFLLYQLNQPKDDFIPSQLIGSEVPAFDLQPATVGIEGLKNSDFADGKVRLLNIFGSWCIPCRAEAPQLEALKEAGVEIHAIAVRDTSEDVAEFLRLYGNPFVKIGSDPDLQIQLLLGSSGVPETYLIDGNGIIRKQYIGDIREDNIPSILADIAEYK